MGGSPFELNMPKVVRIHLTGTLPRPWVTAMDVILEILRRLTVKGGVGKTTLALNFAIARAKEGCDVLLVDADEQKTALTFTALREELTRHKIDDAALEAEVLLRHALGLSRSRLYAEFGREIVFWGGGVDTQRVLPFGTPQDVVDEVKRRIHDLAPGGGFVFGSVHNIQANVPPENIVAMFDTARDLGGYPISV